jgi:methyl coenzyme M reductase alpha subunit
MISNKRESPFLMKTIYIFNHPAFWCMASRTIFSNRSLVKICVAGDAIRFSFGKFKSHMAASAVNRFMLTN